jgi:hypothetical protein
MNKRQLQKKAAAARRQRKIEKILKAIAAGAGCWWTDDCYFEYQESAERSIGSYLEGVRFYFDLPMDCSLFKAWNLKKFSTFSKAAKEVINEIDYQKHIQEQKEKEAV